jgi:hypothetical protein
MTLDQKLEQAKKLLEQIQKVYDELGKTNPFQGMDPNTVALSNKEIDKLEIALTGITKKANDLEKGFGGIAKSIGASLAEMTKQSSATNRTVKAMRSLSSISESLKNDQSDLSELSLKELESKRDKAKILSQEAKSQAALVKQKYDEITLDKNGNQLQGDELNAKLKSLGISKSELQTMNEIVAAHEAQFPVLDELNAKIKERIEEEKKINKTLGLTKVALKGLGKIPIVGPLLDTNKALDAARKKAKAGGGALASMGAAMGSMGKSLASSLGDPLVVIGLLIKGFKMFLDIGFAADKQITDLSKSMAVSHEEASATRDRMIEIQNSSKDIFMTTKNQVGAQMELASAMGATRGFTEQQIADQVLLTKKMGLSVEAAEGIQKLAMANGMTAEDVTDSVIKQTSALAKQTGVQLDNKKITEKVAKVSGQLRLQYANNPKLIAKAVVQTEKLGISLETAANAAKGLLDFESSIENELSAELLTGKALNLERARGLALNGDSVGAAKEMLAQVGSAADFQNMNVIQQEAIAKAVGMSADDLANSLVTQENLSKLGDNTRKQIEEEIEAAKKLGDMDKVRMLEASIGNEKEAQAALKDIDAQATFNQSIETLKSMLSSIVEGPAADFANWIGDSEHGAKRLKNLFESLKKTIAIVAGIIVGKMVFGLATSVGSMIAQVALSRKLKAAAQQQAIAEGVVTALKVTGAEASTLGLATPLILGGLAAVMAGAAAYSLMNDGIISPTGGMVVSGPEGSIQLNKKDSIIAGTNLGGGGNSNQDSSALIAAINGLKSDMKALASRPVHVTVEMDSVKVIEALGKFPNTQGDVNAISSFKVGSGTKV